MSVKNQKKATEPSWLIAKHRMKKHFIFEWSSQRGYEPQYIRNAHGSWYENETGKRYLDFCSSQFNLNLGYQHPKIITAVHNQLDQLAYAPANTVLEIKGELLTELVTILPENLSRIFLTLGGADANENAIKIARMYTGRTKIISRYRSYHGATFGALSIAGDPRRYAIEPGVTGIVKILDPFCNHCPFGQNFETCMEECSSHIEEVVKYEGPKSIAAIIVEPITGSSGVFIPPKNYLKRLREICDKYDILLICDEVACGLGRTGEWFAVDHWKVKPDIITLSKGLTNCYAPLGAVCVTEEIASHFLDNTFFCGLTQGAHPLGCAAAVACLDIYKNENIPLRAKRMGDYQSRRMQEMLKKHEHVRDVRNVGLLGVIEIDFNKENDNNPGRYWNTKIDYQIQEIVRKLNDLGLAVISRWNWIFVAPPLNISKEDHKLGFDILEKAIGQEITQ